MDIQSKKGFSLPEILSVLAIIGLLVTITAGAMRNTADDSTVIAALNQMKVINDGVVLFYKDFGCIPEEVHINTAPGANRGPEYDKHNMNPEYATRFLCLPRDFSNSEINSLHKRLDRYGNLKDAEDFRPGYYFMFQCLASLNPERFNRGVSPTVRSYHAIVSLITDPLYGSRSWTTPYLEANSRFNASALNQKDDTQYPAIFYSDHSMFEEAVLLPVISTPWADDIEVRAREAEPEDPALAEELRKGKYYQIMVYSRNNSKIKYDSQTDEIVGIIWGHWIQVPETAVVISRGPDGLPGTEGDDDTIGAE
ncbi:MAG: prepilin-type N-terminal cleavage/methylation domain-containing protein, partial [Desulfobacteraceae bacterium]